MKHQQTQTTSTVPKKNITQYIYIYISFFILFKQEKNDAGHKRGSKNPEGNTVQPKKNTQIFHSNIQDTTVFTSSGRSKGSKSLTFPATWVDWTHIVDECWFVIIYSYLCKFPLKREENCALEMFMRLIANNLSFSCVQVVPGVKSNAKLIHPYHSIPNKNVQLILLNS